MELKNRIIEPFSQGDSPAPPKAGGENDAARPTPMAIPPLAVRALSASEMEWLQRVHHQLMNRIDLSLIGRTDEKQARNQIRELAERIMEELAAPLNSPTRQVISKRIEDEILGLGPLEPLLADPSISDILVNGSNKIYVERFGKLELTPLCFQSDAHLLNIIDRIVSSVGRRIDESSPMVDARLKDGSRINAIIPPLAIDGLALSIRRFGVDRLGMENLIKFGAFTVPMGSANPKCGHLLGSSSEGHDPFRGGGKDRPLRPRRLCGHQGPCQHGRLFLPFCPDHRREIGHERPPSPAPTEDTD